MLLDSPFPAVLDMLTAQTVAEGFVRMTSSCTLVCAMSSHTHLLPNFDKLLLMNDGVLVADGAPEELQEQVGSMFSLDRAVRLQTRPREGEGSPTRFVKR